MRVLVIGGYGLIGGEAVRLLGARGAEVVGAGRDLHGARRRFPDIEWRQAELGRTDEAGWAAVLQGIEVVVNAAGALQDGLREDLRAVHVEGLRTLVAACRSAGVRRLVHLSAAGVAPGRGGGFNDSKAEGEAIVAAGGLDWVILRPGLVFGPGAFGGTAMLRGLAGFPGMIPAFSPQATIQPVALQVVAQSIARAVQPDAPHGVTLDLVGADRLPLAEVLRRLRGWLGFAPAPLLALPTPIVRLAGRVADGLGWLGWRNPMRTNAIEQIALGMDTPPGGEAALGLKPQAFAEILQALPSTLQERRFARLYFAKPALLIALAAFCAFTGVVSLTSYAASTGLLTRAGLRSPLTDALVVGGAVLDLLAALAICVRRFTSRGLIALIGLSAGYLAIASVLRPDLWLEPLGALPKTLMLMLMAGVALGMMDER